MLAQVSQEAVATVSTVVHWWHLRTEDLKGPFLGDSLIGLVVGNCPWFRPYASCRSLWVYQDESLGLGTTSMFMSWPGEHIDSYFHSTHQWHSPEGGWQGTIPEASWHTSETTVWLPLDTNRSLFFQVMEFGQSERLMYRNGRVCWPWPPPQIKKKKTSKTHN